MMGGALGLAVLASLAASRTDSLRASTSAVAALNGGYHLAFLVGALFAVAAATVGAVFLRTRMQAPAQQGERAGRAKFATAEAD
jgi:hypothetical protein